MELWAFIAGAVFGAAIALVAGYYRARAARSALEGQFREAFTALASDALSANTEQFLALAKTSLASQATAGAAELETRKQLIDQSLLQVGQRLETMRTALQQLESTRREDYGQLGRRLAEAVEQTQELRKTTAELRSALTHPQRRGAWGERMAHDILELAGMIEGVNYTRQQTVEATGKRPDFTFLLPQGVKLNMDVKFPLDNYLRFLQAEGEPQRAVAAEAFCSDVRGQVKALTTREYINPSDGTADFVLMFIPNEQVFASIQELDSSLLADALRRRVVFAGPLSLLAVLAIVRQACETANLSRQTDEALNLLAAFAKQWDSYKVEMDKLGQRLDSAVKQYELLRGTRTNMLEKPLTRLEEIRGRGEAAGLQLTREEQAE